MPFTTLEYRFSWVTQLEIPFYYKTIIIIKNPVIQPTYTNKEIKQPIHRYIYNTSQFIISLSYSAMRRFPPPSNLSLSLSLLRFDIKAISRARRRYRAETSYANKNATTFHCFDRKGDRREARARQGRASESYEAFDTGFRPGKLVNLFIYLSRLLSSVFWGHYGTPPLLTSRNVALTAFIIWKQCCRKV